MDLVGGGVNSRGGYVSKILYVKTKELGPLGGARAGRVPPRSANGIVDLFGTVQNVEGNCNRCVNVGVSMGCTGNIQA